MTETPSEVPPTTDHPHLADLELQTELRAGQPGGGGEPDPPKAERESSNAGTDR